MMRARMSGGARSARVGVIEPACFIITAVTAAGFWLSTYSPTDA